MLKKRLGEIRQNPEAFNQYIWHLGERAQILDKIREIVEESRKIIYLSIWKKELQEVEEVFRGAAAECADEGSQIETIRSQPLIGEMRER